MTVEIDEPLILFKWKKVNVCVARNKSFDFHESMAFLESRAVLLLEKELSKFKKLDLWGIHVDVKDDNLFKWKVKVSGLRDTIWEGSRFDVLVLFTEEYNLKPPSICFETIPMHPNVDRNSGMVCLDCLIEWREQLSISYVLLSLQHMLSSPSLDSPINTEAARMFLMSPNHYKQIVLDYVLSSIREHYRCASSEDSTLLFNGTTSDMSSAKSMRDEKSGKSLNFYKLSYDEYLKQWKAIGTTESVLETKSIDVKDVGVSSCAEEGDKSDSLRNSTLEKSSKDSMCNSVHEESHEKNKKQKRLELLKANKIQLIKDIHANKNGCASVSVSLPKSPVPIIEEDLEVDTMEVNSIISWTENLPDEL